VFDHIWEPLFGTGSQLILRESSISHLLPIPDALLGAAAYFAEAVAAVAGGRSRWRAHPRIVALEGSLVVGLVAVGLLLAVAQPALFQAGCTLCLATTVLSLSAGMLVAPEVRASLRVLRSREQSEGTAEDGFNQREARGRCVRE
jgi:uncharacterized membrane protein